MFVSKLTQMAVKFKIGVKGCKNEDLPNQVLLPMNSFHAQSVKWSHASFFFDSHEHIIQHTKIERMAIGYKEEGCIICVPDLPA